MHVPRRDFSFSPPFGMSLWARTSSKSMPGTWGFGFWNDPFVMGLGLPGSALRLPSLPNSAWFFHASEKNYLSFRKNTPGNGMLAGVFSSPLIPSIFSLAALPFAPLLFLTPSAKILRSLASTLIEEEFVQLDRDWTTWHQYGIEARSQSVIFRLDGDVCMETRIIPKGRLGFLCWIDNQFLALWPDGKFRFGASVSEENYWLEIADVIT
jgi:hypothetical protein